MNFGFSSLYAPSREKNHMNVNGRRLHSTGISVYANGFLKTESDFII